jgi:hypothetical protein
MANQTITNASRNHDSPEVLGLVNGETYTINNSNLTINCDVRWGQNAAVLGRMTISPTLGGNIVIDGRDVWELPFSASTGNVPTLGALGTNTVTGGSSGATGEFFRVWETGNLEPTAAGTAMPATGWIKLRSKTGTFENGEVVTLPGGATITISSIGRRSWIHVVGGESTTVTVPRLGTFKTYGDWYELGTTNGTDDQTFNVPVLDQLPAIQIETAPGSGEYEWWQNAANKWGTATALISTDVRGKFFGQAAAVITIARRASNACGFKPVSGLRVRIPNVILSNSSSTNWALNLVQVTAGARYDFTTTSAGDIEINNVCSNWYFSFTAAFNVVIRDSATSGGILLSNIANAPLLENVAVGASNNTVYVAVTATNLFSGITIEGGRYMRLALNANNTYGITMSDCSPVTIRNAYLEGLGGPTAVARGGSSTGTLQMNRCLNILIEDCISVGSRFQFNTCNNAIIRRIQYCDIHNGGTTATNGISIIDMINASTNFDISELSLIPGLTNVHPYFGLLNTASSCSNITLRDVGTPSSPFEGGSAFEMRRIASLTVSKDIVLRRIYTNQGGGATALVGHARAYTDAQVGP